MKADASFGLSSEVTCGCSVKSMSVRVYLSVDTYQPQRLSQYEHHILIRNHLRSCEEEIGGSQMEERDCPDDCVYRDQRHVGR